MKQGRQPLRSQPWDTTLKILEFLPAAVNPVGGHCQAGSLTGAVASERVTEALKGSLSMDGNHAFECKRISEPNCETDGSSSNESWS